MNKVQKILSIIIIVLIVLFFARNFIIKSAIITGAKAVVGLDLKIASFDIGILKTYLRIKDLKVMNPKGFNEPLMVSIPEIYVNYNLGSFLNGKAHFEDVHFDMEEFIIIKNEQGELNIDAITALADSGKSDKGKKKEKKPKSDKKMPELQIDNLHLKIGEVIYIDYSSGKAKVRRFRINIDEKHENINNPEVLISLIMFKVLSKTTIASLANIDLDSLQGTVSMGLKSAVGLASKTLGVTSEQAQKALGVTKKTLGTATESSKKVLDSTKKGVKSATKKLKGLFKRD